MRKVQFLVFCWAIMISPCLAAGYRIEVLQVGKVEPFDFVYNNMKKELAQNGLIEGQNLTINRTIIDADLDAGVWDKVKILMKIRSQAARIAEAKPDLAVTIATPATKYAKDKIIAAGIPLVFAGVYNPVAVGCKTISQPLPGMTGASNYIDPKDVLRITHLAFPTLKTLGTVYTDDDNAIKFIADAKAEAQKLGITILDKQISKSTKISASAKDLVAQGIDGFLLPADVYYGLRNYEAPRELRTILIPAKIPVVSCIIGGTSSSHGAVLNVGPSFGYVGELAGQQIVKILKEGQKPETLPVLRQENLTVQIDFDIVKILGLQLPSQILMVGKPL